MSMTETEPNPEPPRGHVRVVYLGPVAPHWDLQSDFGDRAMVEGFRVRMQARLLQRAHLVYSAAFRQQAQNASAPP